MQILGEGRRVCAKRTRDCLSFDRQREMAIAGTLVWCVVQDCVFIDRQREKGWRVPRGNPPLGVGVLSMSRPREAFFPRQAKGKRTFSPGSAGEASVGKQSFPKHTRSKHAQPKGRRIAFPLTGRGKWPSQARLFGVLSKIAFSPTGRGKKV